MFRWLIGAFFISLSSGCAIPVHLADEEPFKEEAAELQDLRELSRLQVVEKLGLPDKSFGSGQWWLYHADRKLTEWLVFFCAGTSCGGDTFGGEVREYSLILEFSDDNSIREFTVVNSKEPCNAAQKVCYERQMLLLDPLIESSVEVDPNKCSLYFYVQQSAESEFLVFYQIDDEEPVVRHEDNMNVIRIDRTAGSLKLEQSVHCLGRMFYQVHELECLPKEKYYVRTRYAAKGAFGGEIVSPEIARQETKGTKIAIYQDTVLEDQTGPASLP